MDVIVSNHDMIVSCLIAFLLSVLRSEPNERCMICFPYYLRQVLFPFRKGDYISVCSVLKCGQRELDLVKRYATHDYDQVLGMYYAKARFYDAENRRFVAVDPILDASQYNLKKYLSDPIYFLSMFMSKITLLPTSIIMDSGR